MTADPTNKVASLRALADSIERGEQKQDTCIVILVTDGDPNFTAWFFGEPVTVGDAVLTLEGLVDKLEDSSEKSEGDSIEPPISRTLN